MSRFLIFFALFVLAAGVVVYLGWFHIGASSTTDGNHESVEITMNKDKIKADSAKVTDEVKSVARDAGAGIKKIAGKVERGFSGSEKTVLTAESKSIDLEPGARTTVKILRSGGDLSAMTLALAATSLSNLLVTGGEFKTGEAESLIVIEAAKGATDGTVSVDGNGGSARITVTVKPTK
jgi:hypothetical protein